MLDRSNPKVMLMSMNEARFRKYLKVQGIKADFVTPCSRQESMRSTEASHSTTTNIRWSKRHFYQPPEKPKCLRNSFSQFHSERKYKNFKTSAKAWLNISQEVRDKFVQQGKMDLKRYTDEMAAYKRIEEDILTNRIKVVSQWMTENDKEDFAKFLKANYSAAEAKFKLRHTSLDIQLMLLNAFVANLGRTSNARKTAEKN